MARYVRQVDGKEIPLTAEEIEARQAEEALAALPPTPADKPLNNWRFKAMVAYLGLDAPIRQALGSIPDDLQRAIAISRYENSALYHRDDALLRQMQAALGLDDETVDAAWMQIAE